MNNVTAALRVLKRGVFKKYSPILAQLVVTRYCNLSCGYCNEFDKVSQPIALAKLVSRVDDLARLDTAIITLTGGEPLTNPGLSFIIGHIRKHGMVPTLNTNGFLLTEEIIAELNAAGLQAMQISIDGVTPSEQSQKSLKSLSRKLALLRDHARFSVNINSVFGPALEASEEMLDVATVAKAHGFSHSLSLVHDEEGSIQPMSGDHRRIYERALLSASSIQKSLNHWMFQANLIAGKTNDWRCRAGARYLYICEKGLVHWCSQNRGYPGIPLADYQRSDIVREFDTVKTCAPTCSLNCVHQASIFDAWRPQREQHRPGVSAA